MNTIDEAIEILQAMKEGKQVEYKSGDSWTHLAYQGSSYLPNFYHLTYRIKPEPREIWVNIPFNGYDLRAYTTREEALTSCDIDGKPVRFREVIEE